MCTTRYSRGACCAWVQTSSIRMESLRVSGYLRKIEYGNKVFNERRKITSVDAHHFNQNQHIVESLISSETRRLNGVRLSVTT